MKQIVGNYGSTSYTFDASARTVLINNRPKTLTIESLLAIINVTDQIVIYQPNNTGKGATLVGSTFTLEYDTTLMDDADSLMILIDTDDIAYDSNIDAQKNVVQNPTPSYYQDVVPLISTAYEITNAFADVGFEIPCAGYRILTLRFTIDINTSTNVQIRILHKHTSGGTEEYREIYLGSPAGNNTTINLNDYLVATNADQLFKLSLDVTGTPYVQVQVKDDNDGTGQIDNLLYTLTY